MASDRETEAFDVALGRCAVRDGTLVVERADPDAMGRWDLLRRGVRTNAAHRPWVTAAWLGGSLLLGLAFIALLAFLYLSNPAAAPLVGVLGVLGLLAVAVPLEFNYRRAMRERRRLRAALDEEFSLVRADRVPLDDVTGVTVRPVSTGLLLSDGVLLLVHFRRDGESATTALGFPAFMAGERVTARAAFERYGIPVTDER